MKVWPYCLVFIVPASVVVGTFTGGPGSFMTLVVVFGLIPLFDAVIGLNTANPNVEDEKQLNKAKGFHRVTWFFAVLQVCLVIWGIAMFAGQALTPLEQVGLILSLGTCSGGMGIVVSHELIHRIDSRLEPFLGRMVLASVLYMHWAIEHIAGHHRTVATPEDPATARKGEAFYVFWPRTVMGGIQSAWRIETRRLSRSGKSALSPGNRLLRYYGIEVLLVI